MDELQELEEAVDLLCKSATWIGSYSSVSGGYNFTHGVCRVYFGKCESCGNYWSSKQARRNYCHNETCRQRVCYGRLTSDDWRKRISKLGITGVNFRKRTRRNKNSVTTSHYFTARFIFKNGERQSIYHGKDFFEACCRRKSAEAKHK